MSNIRSWKFTIFQFSGLCLTHRFLPTCSVVPKVTKSSQVLNLNSKICKRNTFSWIQFNQFYNNRSLNCSEILMIALFINLQNFRAAKTFDFHQLKFYNQNHTLNTVCENFRDISLNVLIGLLWETYWVHDTRSTGIHNFYRLYPPGKELKQLIWFWSTDIIISLVIWCV